MSNSDNHFWPYKRRTIIHSVIIILLGLLFTVAILKETINWPTEKNDTSVLIGILIFSLLPVVLALVDSIFERGGVIQYGSLKIDLSHMSQMGMTDFTIPVNIEERGALVQDSGQDNILIILKKSASCDVAIIDLEDGHAWWETRLLVLIAGAERLERPAKIVFIGTVAGKKKQFLGWSHPNELLPLLLKVHPQYPVIYQQTRAAARQWELVEPSPDNPTLAQRPFSKPGLAENYSNLVFDATGSPKELFAEQMLAMDLQTKIENPKEPKTISTIRLKDLFKPVLYTDGIDESESQEKQISTFFENDSDYLVITNNGKYSTIVSRLTVLSTILKTMVEQK